MKQIQDSAYYVTEDGRVYSLKSYIYLKPMLTGRKRAQYYSVNLRLNGVRMHKISRLVATAFIPNPLNLPQVNHIDGNKLNDHVTNLEWTDESGNMLHAYKMGLNKSKRGLTDEQVLKVRELKKTGMAGSKIAAMFSVNKVTIHMILRGEIYKNVV